MLYSPTEMPGVFVIAKDWMLRAGVRAELHERGIGALGFETPAQAAAGIAQGSAPSALVLEAAGVATDDAALASLIRHVPTLWIASPGDAAAIPAGVAAVMHRPFSIGDVVSRVCELLQGQAA